MSEPPPDSRKCAICGKPQDPDFRPFCSKRCADVDLGRWLNEGYSIPGGEPPPEENDGGSDPA
jgi:endogenous inhibitor of DNA gyrase (YacG/DUF329 family)